MNSLKRFVGDFLIARWYLSAGHQALLNAPLISKETINFYSIDFLSVRLFWMWSIRPLKASSVLLCGTKLYCICWVWGECPIEDGWLKLSIQFYQALRDILCIVIINMFKRYLWDISTWKNVYNEYHTSSLIRRTKILIFHITYYSTYISYKIFVSKLYINFLPNRNSPQLLLKHIYNVSNLIEPIHNFWNYEPIFPFII